MPDGNRWSRRRFLKRSAGATVAGLGFPAIVPSHVFAARGGVLPSETLTVGCVGMGNMGGTDMRSFLSQPDVRVVAVCDVDAERLERAKGQVDAGYGNGDCAAYGDFRRIVERDDIDIVQITTPDHWHSIIAVAAAKAGKDIYGEKPLSHTLREGRAMCDAVQRYGRVWQTGSWQRSEPDFRFACELVLNGRIGKVRHVDVGLPQGFSSDPGDEGETVTSPPPGLDYDFWLGPAPYADYVPARVHWNWRWNLEYGGGQLLDWVGHHVDIAHWGLGLDRTGPVEVEGVGEFLDEGLWNAATTYRVDTRYANGITMTIAGGDPNIVMGTKWIGDDGWVWVSRGGIDAEPASLLQERFGADEIRLAHVGSPVSVEDHTRNFLDCVRTRATTLAPAEVAHRSATPGHLGIISMLLGRKLRFDPDTEQIIDDPSASRMLGKAMRSPWTLE